MIEISLRLKLFKAAYHYLDDATDKKDNKYNKDEVIEKIKNDFGNKGFNENEINSAIQKIPEIFDIIIKERNIE